MMIFRRLHRARSLTACILAVAFGIMGLGAHVSNTRVQTDREIRAPLAFPHFAAVPSTRVFSAAGAPANRAGEPTTHTPAPVAAAALRRAFNGASTQAAPTPVAAQQHARPRRLAFSYDATAPPLAL
jgi:hypothetical protein